MKKGEKLMKEKIQSILKNKRIVIEIVAISSCLIIGLSLLLVFTLTAKEGNAVAVLVNGKKVAEYPLSKDGEYLITGYNGGTNLLVIEDGKAYVKEASCPQEAGGACVDQGKKHRVGEVITCIPNKVVFEIIGEGEGDEPLI